MCFVVKFGCLQNVLECKIKNCVNIIEIGGLLFYLCINSLFTSP